MQLAVAAAWMWLVTFLQNTAETKGLIPTLLPTAGLVTTAAGGLLGSAVGTIDTVVQEGGTVVGDVVSTTGNVVGGVVGVGTGLLGGTAENTENMGGV
jgi:hypothetical protein